MSVVRTWFESILTIMGMRAPVESAMRSPPVTASATHTVSSVIEKMLTERVGGVIIMSGDSPIGIVTERDIIERVVRTGKDLDKTLAQEVMSSTLITVDSDVRVRDALSKMRDEKIGRNEEWQTRRPSQREEASRLISLARAPRGFPVRPWTRGIR